MNIYQQTGYEDWLLQRFSSVVLLLYIGILLGFWAIYADSLTRIIWYDFLMSPAMRVLGGLSSVALMVHAIIGSWVVLTDYVKINWLQLFLIFIFYVIIVGSNVLSIYVFLQF